METNYIPHSLIINIVPGNIASFIIWINTTEGTYGSNNSFTTNSNGITGIFIKI
jgi:hypothetical protein